jgi:nucleotide-binding universal stress UspA family protein
MYQTILHATDGSPYSAAAAENAVELAAQYDATLHVVSVVETDVAFSEAISEQILDDLEKRGQQAVDAVAERAGERGVSDVHTAVVRGTPHRAILDYAADHDADLVVVGTHGRTGLNRLLLGSVAERVLRTAERPVLVVRGEPEEAEE